MRQGGRHGCPGRRMSRRHFIARANAAAAGLLFAGPLANAATAQPAALGSSAVSMARISGYDRDVIRAAVESMFGALGGLGDIVRPGDHVGIKINLTGGNDWATSFYNQTGGMHPGETYWTHPEILRAVSELVSDAGAGQITVVEAIYDTASYNDWGYYSVVRQLGAAFVDLNEVAPYSDYTVRPVGSGAFLYDDFTQNGILNEFDCVVSLAKSKRHNGAGVTHGMKNLVGTLPLPSGLYNNGQGHRAAIHERRDLDGNIYSNLRRVVLDLNQATPIHLVVNDAVKTVLGGEGPWGPLTTASFDTLIASKDPVAADAIGTQVIGFDPYAADGTGAFAEGLNYLRLAEQLGMGTADPREIDVSVSYSTGIDRPDLEHTAPRVSVFPNPFSETATFEIGVRASTFCTLDIFDVEGRRVRRLLARSVPAGQTVVEWDGHTVRGPAAAGVYVARLSAAERVVHRTLVRA